MVDEEQDFTAVEVGIGLTDWIKLVILNNNYYSDTSSFVVAVGTDKEDASIKF